VILETIGTLIVGGIGGIGAWAATDFVARPIRKFFDLRADAIRLVSEYGNVRPRFEEVGRLEVGRALGRVETSEDLTLSDTDLAKLRQAEGALRALASQMRGFAYNETIANSLLRLRGFDPKKASEGLFEIANTFGTRGDTRIKNKQMVTEALRLPEHTL
jgi:hypothetical protein